MEYFQELGYLGLFISSFLSATLIPLSPEIVLSVLIAKGFNIPLSIIIATLGNWFGSIFTYFIGRIGDWKKIEKYFKIKKERVFNFKIRIDKYGSFIAFFSWMPFIGDILALSLGFFKVNFTKVSIWMLFGKTIRFVVVSILIYYGIEIVS
ncbi:MAG: DedA family protein [Flavobacteriaceae bacterium]|nr:DedA family protein [Flavobacteriaceae bacterium]MBL6685179.1 DedA family protein [Flavobacteriaceae bacterium]|tara:strand:- start:15498 stop:15950 length:453 start_codon:yes stop_codon:yes gene_type:complete